jgi:hypothetical protein
MSFLKTNRALQFGIKRTQCLIIRSLRHTKRAVRI